MKNTLVDFESYYSKKDGISVTDQGNANYYRAADAYILSIVDDEYHWCGTIDQCRAQWGEGFWTDPNRQFWAANSNFDQGWAEKYFPKSARPWKCILDLGAHHQLPRHLAGLTSVVLKRKIDKSVRDEMNGVDFFSLPDAEQQRVVDYCLNDSVESYEILHRLAPMTSIEDEIAEHTRMCNRRGVAIDLDLVEADKTRIEAARFEAFKAIPWHTFAKPLSYVALKAWCDQNGIPVPASTAKTDEECTDLMSAHPRLSEVLTNMRRFRKANTMLEKCRTLEARVCDGILPLDLIYCGAPHTRRWSSRGFNIQNLDKEPWVCTGNLTWKQISELKKRGESVPDTSKWVWTRAWVKPRPGKIFVILDYAQIEPRCLNWLVGNEEMLSAIRAGYSVYEAYALAFKGWRGNPGTLKLEIGIGRYTRIKNEVLGLGYGMGAGRYTEYAGIDEKEAKEVVDAFRKDNPKIPEFWSYLDKKIKAAIVDKEKLLQVQMPTGELLRHFDVRSRTKIEADGRKRTSCSSTTVRGDYSANCIQPNLWGGVLTENVTQRMARDVLAGAVIRLEKAGLPVVFHAHDEVVLEVDIDNKDDAKETAEHIMKQAPEWASDLPLGVEGDFAESYTK